MLGGGGHHVHTYVRTYARTYLVVELVLFDKLWRAVLSCHEQAGQPRCHCEKVLGEVKGAVPYHLSTVWKGKEGRKKEGKGDRLYRDGVAG